MKKHFSAVITFAVILSMLLIPVEAAEKSGFDYFIDVNEYTVGLFTDVPEGEWFTQNVETAYRMGLMLGNGDNTFDPTGDLTLAQAVTMSSRMHSIFLTGEENFAAAETWYTPYVEYAIEKGIIAEGEFAEYEVPATRAQFAYILSGALPAEELEQVNIVEDDAIPDLGMEDEYAANIYMLYRAGILAGNDSRGSFYPAKSIARAEAAAIASRMVSPGQRVSCEFYAPEYPYLKKQARADNSFFEDTAILGNSLVDGLRLFSKLSTVDFYCGTSMSVYSAMNNKNIVLKNGSLGSQLDAMAQTRYGKVYIELGINEIGGDVKAFKNLYATMIDEIKADQPTAEVYIMSLTPVSRARSQGGGVFTRERVQMYNAALLELAAEKDCFYLDVFTPLADEEGYLPSEDTWDGVHFVGAKYLEWEEVIRTYYA